MTRSPEKVRERRRARRAKLKAKKEREMTANMSDEEMLAEIKRLRHAEAVFERILGDTRADPTDMVIGVAEAYERFEAEIARLRSAIEVAVAVFDGYALHHDRKAQTFPVGSDNHGIAKEKAEENRAHARALRLAVKGSA
jgi:hypothetical protein